MIGAAISLVTKNDGDRRIILPEKGPQKEIINSGEPVELGVFAEASGLKEQL